MLEIRALRAGYGKLEVLHGLDLCCRPGELTVLIGPNGCGKSTLLKSCLGLAQIFGGTVQLDGEALPQMERRRRAQLLAYLPQARNTPDITVRRLVLHGRFPHLDYPRRYREEDLMRAEEAMRRVGVYEMADRPLAALSGGERQRVYLAMLLAQDTQVVLMDEPTTYLDIYYQLQTLALARSLAQSGRTVLLALHDLNLAFSHADCIALLQAGKLVEAAPVPQMIASGRVGAVFGVELLRRAETCCEFRIPEN